MRRYYVSFPSLQHLTLAGELRIPTTDNPLPAVLIVHGSAGVDSRGAFYSDALNNAGIATLQIDMWTARGLKGGVDGRPKSALETLPDVYGAFKYLATRAEIDPSRIGIMGFSWGGVCSMLTATKSHTERYLGSQRFAAHAPFYPVFWRYNRAPGFEFRTFTGAPVLIQAGRADAYDDPDGCEQLLADLPEEARGHIRARVYDGATHGWDRLQEGPMRAFDPNAGKGQGAWVDFTPNPQVARRSRRAVVNFFRQVLL
ncbi:MAG: dienelactone hydrolase family protein [Meiothermus sp.]|nr:dienelactone hydrolase family protein [Meiothermus sp.]